jgi:hypothetical protein
MKCFPKDNPLTERIPLCDVALISAVSVFLIGPLLTPHWIRMGESIDQVVRVIELARGIREGSLYPRWFGDLAGGFGSPYFVFYSPLIYYVSVLFHFIGFGILTSLKCMIVVGVLMAGTGMFCLARPFWGTSGAVVSAVAYLYVPYRIVNLYVRGDFAEAFAMSIVPWLFYFVHGALSRKHLFHLAFSGLSYAALVLTHNCTALTASGLIVLFLLFFSMRERDWRGPARAMGGLALGCGLSALFWLPALLEKHLVNIELIYSNAAFDFHNNFLEPFRLLSPIWSLDAGIGGRELPLQIGAPHVLLSIISAISYYKLRNQISVRGKDLFIFFSLVSVFLVFLMHRAAVFIWECIPLLRYIQFPWRLLAISALAVSFLTGSLFAVLESTSETNKQIVQLVLVAIIVLSGAQYCYVRGYYILDDKGLTASFVREQWTTVSSYNTKEMNRVHDFGEYLPKTVERLPAREHAGRIAVTEGKAVVSSLKTWMQGYEFEASVEEEAEVTIGSFYYPGWEARADGKGVPLFTDPEGLIHLNLPPGVHHVKVFFGNSAARRGSAIVSLLSCMIFLGFFVKPFWKKQIGNPPAARAFG